MPVKVKGIAPNEATFCGAKSSGSVRTRKTDPFFAVRVNSGSKAFGRLQRAAKVIGVSIAHITITMHLLNEIMGIVKLLDAKAYVTEV